MDIGQRLKDKTQQIRELKSQLKTRENELKCAYDIVSAQSNEIDVLQSKLNDWERKQQQGYSAVAINDGYIVDGVKVLPYSQFIYMQDIPHDITNHCYKVINGKIELDIQKYNKIRGGL